MKTLAGFIIVLAFYSCENKKQPDSFTKEESPLKQKDSSLIIFNPGSFYYTIRSNNVNSEWKDKGYILFQSRILDSFNNQHFELLDIYGNENNIVVFTEYFDANDTIKYVILDTLVNYGEFANDIPGHGTSFGVFSTDELKGINTKGLDPKSIISVVVTGGMDEYKKEMDSAVTLQKKQHTNPFDVIDVKRNLVVLKAWLANTKTQKFEVLKK